MSLQPTRTREMYNLMGEYEIRLDEKNRLRLPTSLIKQLGEDIGLGLVINRGTERCLNLYPKKTWDYKSGFVNQLNLYNPENKEFARYFYRGATAVELDASSRIIIPKLLLDHASIQQDIVINAFGGEIEIWSLNDYKNLIANEPKNAVSLAQKIFGQNEAK